MEQPWRNALPDDAPLHIWNASDTMMVTAWQCGVPLRHPVGLRPSFGNQFACHGDDLTPS